MANLTLLPKVVKYFLHQREKFSVEVDFDAETATPPQRLEHFIGARYSGWGSKGRFAEAAGMPVEQLSQYLPAVKPGREKAMRMPGGDVLLRFQQAGMSIDWWASGKGGMDAPESMAKSRSLADQLEEIALKVRDVQLDELRSKVRAVDQDAARLPF